MRNCTFQVKNIAFTAHIERVLANVECELLSDEQRVGVPATRDEWAQVVLLRLLLPPALLLRLRLLHPKLGT